MSALGMIIVWAGYGWATYGWNLLQGYDITLKQWFDPLHLYYYPKGGPGQIGPGKVFPGGKTNTVATTTPAASATTTGTGTTAPGQTLV